jgi:histidinol phosphatase-like enzyme
MKDLQKRIKAILKGEQKTVWFDIDETLTQTKGNDYENAQPIPKMIELVNKLYDKGCTIILFTGRGGTSGTDWTKTTENQLQSWGVKYHNLIMGFSKDIVIDDCSMLPKEFLGEMRDL